jgi:AcrR family transcriptional regulator
MNVRQGTAPRRSAPRRTQSERRAETRARLLDSAWAIFARDGYHSASLEEIAERAGYSKGALYYNFAGKEDLFLALLDERISAHVASIEAAFAAPAQPAEQISQVAHGAMAAIGDAEWRLLFFEALTFAARNAAFAAKLHQRFEQLRAAVAAAIASRSAEAASELPLPAERIATVLVALANGLAADELVATVASPGELYSDALRYLFVGLASEAGRLEGTPRSGRG